MESVKVLVTTVIGDELLQQIRDVSPRIQVSDASKLVHGEEKGDLSGKAELDALLAEAEVIYGLWLPKNVVARAPKLKWVQMMFAGVDSFLDQFRESPVMMTSVSGIHAVPISEVVFELMLMFAKRAPLCFQLKQERRWMRFTPAVLCSKTVGIVGLGSIGKEVARLAKAFNMRVIATRRSVKKERRARYVDVLLPREQLPRLLSESDFVVLSLPLTPETKKLIGEKELRTMKPTAYLINVARGDIVDEEALLRALEEKWIAGAGLDVFSTEPLPVDSRFWELPNVIISPHIAGVMEDYFVRATGLFCENLRRYVSGERLINLVDKNKGY